MKFNIHWVLYPVLGLILLCGAWYWHKEEIKDALAAQAVTLAKTSQSTTDKQVTASDDSAKKDLQSQNAALQSQLNSAKTLAQQLALLNKQADVHASEQPTVPVSSSSDPHQAINPSPTPMVVLPTEDVPILLKQTVDFKEAENQVAADQIQIAGDKQQISSRDNTIASQNKEITQLKGGSRFKRILKAAEHIAIGVGVGYVVAKEVK